MNKKNEVLAIVESVLDTIHRNDYGLGECGYYFKEAEKELIEEGATKEEAYEIVEEAEALTETLHEYHIYGIRHG